MGRRQRTSRAVSVTQSRPVEDEELDIDAFSHSLEPSGLAIRDVSNDGNCFFRAVSDQLYGTEEYHMKLRERACDYLLAHKDHYQCFVDDEQSFDDYVADMRADGVWADNLELQAISMVYNVNIRVHQSGKPSYDIRNHLGRNSRAIHISYHFGEHYASVRPLLTANFNVPAQHQPLPVSRASSASSGHDSRSSSQDGATRRPRHGNSVEEEDSVAAVWERAHRGHYDLFSLVDKTGRAARAIRFAEPGADRMDGKRDIAKSVERDMKAVLARLDEIGDAIMDGKTAHRMRTKKILQQRRERHYRSGHGSESDVLSTGSEEDDEEYYAKNVRRKTDSIFASLNETENAVRIAVQKITAITGETLAGPGATPATSSKNPRGSKKREQEAKRRERKERRRKEQERLARGGLEDMQQHHLTRTHEVDIVI